MAHLLIKSHIATLRARLARNTPKCAPVAYNGAFYGVIIAERRRLGSTGYVDIDECMRVTGRTFDTTEDNCND